MGPRSEESEWSAQHRESLGAEVGVSEGNPGPGSEPEASFDLPVGEAGAGTKVSLGQLPGPLKGSLGLTSTSWKEILGDPAQSKALDPY